MHTPLLGDLGFAATYFSEDACAVRLSDGNLGAGIHRLSLGAKPLLGAY